MAKPCGGASCYCAARHDLEEGEDMTSTRKAESNRRNARKSTGPRTVDGKARTRWNATQHGLLSARTLLPTEAADTFKDFGSKLHADLAPVGDLEELLVDRVVSTSWRLRRAIKVEAAVYERRSAPRSRDTAEPELALVVLLAADNGKILTNLARYEAAIERSLYRALHELQRLQAAREKGSPIAPMAVDVDVVVGAAVAP
jgi:hypothetical protein